MQARPIAAIRRGLVAATLGLAGLGTAQAGLVTGNWDPQFGPDLPGLSYQVRVTMSVPDACSAQSDGIYATDAGACAGASMVSARLRLFDTANGDAANFEEINAFSNNADFHTIGGSVGYGIFAVRVEGGMVVGLQAGRIDQPPPAQPPLLTPVLVGYVGLGPTLANFFGMMFDTNGPQVFCDDCNGGADVFALTDDAEGFVVTYTDGGAPKFADANGNAIGAVLDGDGVVTGLRAVPLPGTLALMAAGLGVLLPRRRRA